MRRAALALLLAVSWLPAGPAAPPARAQVPVKVERVKPQKEDLPTLQFLKENRDFLRSRMDVLRQVPVDGRDESASLDPRFLTYREMMASLAATQDTLDAQRRWEDASFLASVTDLGDVESELDQLASLLDGQEGRLAGLEADFLGRQETAVVVVVRGLPERADRCPATLQITDGFGNPVRAALDPDRMSALREGGIVQIYHDYAEPREQTWELDLSGGPWQGTDPAFLHFEPVRNALNFLELDLAALDPKDGAAGVHVRAWTRSPGEDGAEAPR